MASPTLGQTIQTFVSGASNATQATAQTAFQTALAAISATGPVVILFCGMSTAANSQAAGIASYTFWAFVQYVSAV